MGRSLRETTPAGITKQARETPISRARSYFCSQGRTPPSYSTEANHSTRTHGEGELVSPGNLTNPIGRCKTRSSDPSRLRCRKWLRASGSQRHFLGLPPNSRGFLRTLPHKLSVFTIFRPPCPRCGDVLRS